jgi:drug/metabolite transporter (DMT)-like permease
MGKSNIKVHLALLAVALIYGASYSIAKMVMPELVGPFGFILIRAVSATIIFFVVYKSLPNDPITHGRDYFRLIVSGFFGIAANQLLFFNGLSMTSTISASVLMTTNPIIVLALSYFFKRERITRTKVVGVMVGSAGAIMLLLRGDIGWARGEFLGDFLILMNATSYACYLIVVQPLMKRYHSITVMFWVFLFGMIFIIPFGLGEFLAIQWQTMPWQGWFSISFVIVFTTVFAYLLNVWALKHVNPSIVSYYIYLQPFFATVISLVFLEEAFNLTMIIYTFLIFLGVYLVSKK